MNTKEAIEFCDHVIDNFKCIGGYSCKELDEKKEAIVALLKRGARIEEDLIQFSEKENPYPEDVFLPIKKEDFNKINDLLKKEMGYSIDRLSGNMCRKLYRSIIEILKEMIK